jgi:hypothetical protein
MSHSVPPLELELITQGDSQSFLQIRDALYKLWHSLNVEISQSTPEFEGAGTLAAQPTLGVGDAGFIYNITDYGHRVRWTGSVWEWAPGDPGNDYFAFFRAAPTANGWQVCDGSTVARLVIGGATLTTSNVTLPNLSGSAAYLKTAAAYTGSIVAASGSTASAGSHDHGFSTGNNDASVLSHVPGVYTQTSAADPHGHSGTTDAVGDHAHGVGSIDLAHLDTLPYYRR